MVTAAWDTSNLVALYKNGKQCTSCCFEGYEPGICCPGFGENSTPSQYTVFFESIEDCVAHPGAAGLNGTWVLDLTECPPQWPEQVGCEWRYDDGSIKITLGRLHQDFGEGCVELFLSAWFVEGGWIVGFTSGYAGVPTYTATTGWCDVLDNFPACSSILGQWGQGGTGQIWPLAWPAWGISTGYTIDDMVQNGTDVYICIEPHTSAAINEPGVGANWTAFWNEEDPCGDANVVCP